MTAISGQFRRRIGIGKRTADGAARAGGGMSDEGDRARQQRQFRRDQPSRSTVHCRVVAPIADRVAVGADIGQRSNAIDVDQPSGAGQPHRHHRHQRLSAGDHACVLVGGKQRAGFVERGGDGNTRTALLS